MGQLPLLAFPSSVRVSFFLSFPCLVAFIMGHDQLKITAISRIGFEPISLGDFPFSRSWSHPPYLIALIATFFFLFFFCALDYVSNALHHFLFWYFRYLFIRIWRPFFFLGRVSLKTCFDAFPYFHKIDWIYSNSAPPKKNEERLVGNRRLGLPTKKDMGILGVRFFFFSYEISSYR